MASKRLFSILLSACTVLALAAVGCGDDDNGSSTDAGAVDSGSEAGSGGKDSGGGGDVPQCIADTVARSIPEACASCACEKKLAAATACADDANCWAMISCIGDHCAADSSCASTTCKDYLPGLLKAGDLATTLRGECMSACITSPGSDAGTDDGGADAGE